MDLQIPIRKLFCQDEKGEDALHKGATKRSSQI